MKGISDREVQIFNRLKALADAMPDNYVKLNRDESYMPLYVEKLYDIPIGSVYNLAHYGEQNGDAMRDPSMDFLVSPNGFVYPINFQNDYVGVRHTAVYFEEKRILNYDFNRYKSLLSFSHDWLRNIAEQQQL
jgi:hypothetical protein